MCALCEAAADQKFIARGTSFSSDLFALSIAPQELIDESNVRATRQLTATDGVLDYYLHVNGGAIQVSGGGFGEQTIQSVAISGADKAFFDSMVDRLDEVIDLDFRKVWNAGQADVDLYYDSEIDLGGGGQTLGLATTSTNGWELFVNYPPVANDENYRRYVLIHEFGHALGLEHPFESGDGDSVNGSSDPWLSSFPEETVMAYRNPAGGIWPEFFTQNDLDALIQIWGYEQGFVSQDSAPTWNFLESSSDIYSGSASADLINGARGDDVISGEGGDDQIRGGKDWDWLNGNSGNDEVYGDRGNDDVRGGKGNDRVRGGKGDDLLNGDLGDDQLWGDLGADRIRLSRGNDTVWGFSYADGDRLELTAGLSYQLQQERGDLQVRTALGVTTLLGVNVDEFQVDAISWV